MAKKDDECAVCRTAKLLNMSREEALAYVRKEGRQMIAKYGWQVDVITDEAGAHTHGLLENYGHLDIEVMLPTSTKQRYELIAPVAEAIKAGKRFQAGQEYNDVFNVPIRFVEAVEGSRRVLRAVFPDPCGRFPGDEGCQPGYAEQTQGTA